jgi:hypothetical protein
VRVASPLVARGRLGIEARFPYGTGRPEAADWTKPEAHETTLHPRGEGRALVARRLDQDRYEIEVGWRPAAALDETERHALVWTPKGDFPAFEMVFDFRPAGAAAAWARPPAEGALATFAETLEAARSHWAAFWERGGAIELSGSRDPRARELERRIVLSQYLTAIQCAGRLPPQETGLTYNSWEGKFHLEMHLWHAAHFALWNRLPLLERSLGYYDRILPRARSTAARQGYAGARWPKMTDPTGAESPSTIGPFLIWQQPHPIFYAELVRRSRPGRATFERFRDVVFATADFMASFPVREPETGRYVLGPPLQCAQERFPKASTVNCTFELAYWAWGLETAQRWREGLGLPRDPEWEAVRRGLAALPLAQGRYLFAETAGDTYRHTRWNDDHPAVLGAFGLLPGPGVDREAMRRTFDWIGENWRWPETWGWDYPLVAMSAARLGQPGRAVDALLMDTPKNRYRANGHNHQRPGLTVYLPGNGGLLYAVALMAAGWDGGPARNAPGFPDDGSWSVRHEGLERAP